MPLFSSYLTRRQFLKAGVAAGAASLLPRSATAAAPALRIGYLPITDAAPLLVAHGLGYFSQEGLKVDRPVMVRSWNILSESFLTGKFTLTHLLFPIPVWMRFRQKFPVRVLAWDHTNGSAITVRSDSGIQNFSDLRGRQVAVPSWYSMHNLVLQLGLRTHGLTPVIQPQSAPLGDTEVNLFVLPPPDMPTALLGKKTDAFIVADPFNALAELKFNARIMRHTGDIWKNHPCCVIVAAQPFIDQHPVVVQKAITAIVRAQAFCRANPKETAHLLSRDGEGYLPVPEDVVLRVFENPLPEELVHPEWNVPRIDFQPYPFPSATRFIIEQMKQTRVEGDIDFLASLDPVRATAELVDDRFVLKALDELGGIQKFCDCDMDTPYTREEIVEIGG